MKLEVVLLLAALTVEAFCVKAEEANDDSEGQTSSTDSVPADKEKEPKLLKFTPPHMSTEEIESRHMPVHHKCDACRAIAYKLSEAFLEAHTKRPRTSLFRESEVIDLVEAVCGEGFVGYGLKSVDGVNRLSGPGLETADMPGMVQMGGMWPKRMRNMCDSYLGEVGEMEIYEAWLNQQTDNNALEIFLCRGEDYLGECNRDAEDNLVDEEMEENYDYFEDYNDFDSEEHDEL